MLKNPSITEPLCLHPRTKWRFHKLRTTTTALGCIQHHIHHSTPSRVLPPRARGVGSSTFVLRSFVGPLKQDLNSLNPSTNNSNYHRAMAPPYYPLSRSGVLALESCTETARDVTVLEWGSLFNGVLNDSYSRSVAQLLLKELFKTTSTDIIRLESVLIVILRHTVV